MAEHCISRKWYPLICVDADSQELVNGPSSTLTLPSDIIEQSSGRAALVNPLPTTLTVEIGGLVARVNHALGQMRAAELR
jgi:hypothetical protein